MKKIFLVVIFTILVLFCDAANLYQSTPYPINVYIQTAKYCYQRIRIQPDDKNLVLKTTCKKNGLLINIKYKQICCKTIIINPGNLVFQDFSLTSESISCEISHQFWSID